MVGKAQVMKSNLHDCGTVVSLVCTYELVNHPSCMSYGRQYSQNVLC